MEEKTGKKREIGIKTEEEQIVSVTNSEEQPPIENSNTIPETNVSGPSLDIPAPAPSNPLFNNMAEEDEQPADPEDDSSFWFPSDTPDALNELPDLEVSTNNFFGENNMSELQFPDLNLNFSANDTEGNQ